MSDKNIGGPPPGAGGSGNQPDWYSWAGDGQHQNPNQRGGGQGQGNSSDFYQWSGQGPQQGRQGGSDYYQYSGDGGQTNQPNRFYEDAYNQAQPGDRNMQQAIELSRETGRPIYVINCRNAYFNMPENDYRNGGPDFRGVDPSYMQYRQQMENTPYYSGQPSYANNPYATQWNAQQQRYLQYQEQQAQAYQAANMYAQAYRNQYQPQLPQYNPAYNYNYNQPQYRSDSSYSAAGPGTLIYGDNSTTYNTQPWNQPGYVGTPPFVNDGSYNPNSGLNNFNSVFRTVAPAVIAALPFIAGGHHRGGYNNNYYPQGYYGPTYANQGYYNNNNANFFSIRARF